MTHQIQYHSLTPNSRKAKVLSDILFYCTTVEKDCAPDEILEHVMLINGVQEEQVGGDVYAGLFALTRSGALETNTMGEISSETVFKGNPLLLQMVHHGAWEPETFEEDEQ